MGNGSMASFDSEHIGRLSSSIDYMYAVVKAAEGYVDFVEQHCYGGHASKKGRELEAAVKAYRASKAPDAVSKR